MNLLDLNLLYSHKAFYIKKATKSLYKSDTHKVNKTIINNCTIHRRYNTGNSAVTIYFSLSGYL